MINFEERVRQMQEVARKEVEERGFYVNGVINSFIYTSGLASKGLPDVIASAPTTKGCTILVAEAAEFLMAGKAGMFEGYESENACLKDGSPVRLKLVELPWSDLMRNEYVTRADDLYDRYPHLEVKPRRLVQLLLSDAKGVLPDEPNYSWPHFKQELYYQFGKVVPLPTAIH